MHAANDAIVVDEMAQYARDEIRWAVGKVPWNVPIGD